MIRNTIRGMEWSLPAFVSMQAVLLFLPAGAVIKFVLWAVSIIENTDGEQQAPHNFSTYQNISFIKGKVVLRQVIWLTPPKQDNRCNCGSTNPIPGTK